MSLTGVPLGTRFRVTGIRFDNPRAMRLMEMGLIEGAEIEVVRRAPLGDPVQLRVGDYELSVRSSEAELVSVTAL
jgi:Fe2+ transport system protein FeoA